MTTSSNIQSVSQHCQTQLSTAKFSLQDYYSGVEEKLESRHEYHRRLSDLYRYPHSTLVYLPLKLAVKSSGADTDWHEHLLRRGCTLMDSLAPTEYIHSICIKSQYIEEVERLGTVLEYRIVDPHTHASQEAPNVHDNDPGNHRIIEIPLDMDFTVWNRRQLQNVVPSLINFYLDRNYLPEKRKKISSFLVKGTSKHLDKGEVALHVTRNLCNPDARVELLVDMVRLTIGDNQPMELTTRLRAYK